MRLDATFFLDAAVDVQVRPRGAALPGSRVTIDQDVVLVFESDEALRRVVSGLQDFIDRTMGAEVVQFNVTRSPDRDPTPPRAA